MRQTTGGAVTCASGAVDCNSFWTDHTSSLPNNGGDLVDMHRPTDAWWVMIVAFIFTVLMVYRVWRYTPIIGLASDRLEHERRERVRAAAAAAQHRS